MFDVRACQNIRASGARLGDVRAEAAKKKEGLRAQMTTPKMFAIVSGALEMFGTQMYFFKQYAVDGCSYCIDIVSFGHVS